MNQAQIERDKAIQKVDASACDNWKSEAILAVTYIAMSNETFTTDEVWARLKSPVEPRAMGAVMRRAQRLGICKPTMMVKNSIRSECHARPLRVWKSEINS